MEGQQGLKFFRQAQLQCHPNPHLWHSPHHNKMTLPTIAFGTERFDQGGNFASNTFTAPVAGKYQLNAIIGFTNLDSAASTYQLAIVTSNDTYFSYVDPDFGQDSGNYSIGISVLADMDASDTASVTIRTSDGTAQADILVESFFSGYLAC